MDKANGHSLWQEYLAVGHPWSSSIARESTSNACHSMSPINISHEQPAFRIGESGDVGDKVAVVVSVEEHFAAGAVVVGLVVLPAHHEVHGPQIRLAFDVQVAVMDADVGDGSDGVDEVAAEERFLD